MKIRIYVILLIYLITTNLFAGWERTFGGPADDRPYDIIQTTDKGFLIAGTTESFGFGEEDYPDVYLLKVDSLGNELWSKTFGYSDQVDEGSRLIQTTGGYYLTGEMFNPANSSRDMFLMKLDETGDSLWTRFYGSYYMDHLQHSILLPNSDILLVGTAGDGSFGDACAVLTDSIGTLIWSNQFGEYNCFEYIKSVATTSDSCYLLSITKRQLSPSVGYFKLLTMKMTEYGDTVWINDYPAPYNNYMSALTPTSDGAFLLTGAYDVAPFVSDWWILKLNELGETVWSKRYTMGYSCVGQDIKLLPDGGFIAINTVQHTVSSLKDIMVSRLDSEGDTLWNAYFGGDNYDLGSAVIPTEDGGFAIAGAVSSFGAGDYDFFVAKLDSLGSSTIEEDENLPIAFEMHTYPNPFNSAVTITLDCHSRENGNPEGFTVEIYDVNGRRVADIIPPDPPLTRGEEERKSPLSKGDLGGLIVWRPDESLPSGVYLVRARVDSGATATKRVVYLK